MIRYHVRKVYYTDDNGNCIIEKVSEMMSNGIAHITIGNRYSKK